MGYGIHLCLLNNLLFPLKKSIYCIKIDINVCVFSWVQLKGFFHGSAHARVLRNLICVPAQNKANFRGFTRRSVRGGFHLKKSLSVLHIGDQKSFCLDHILFQHWVLVLFFCSFA